MRLPLIAPLVAALAACAVAPRAVGTTTNADTTSAQGSPQSGICSSGGWCWAQPSWVGNALYSVTLLTTGEHLVVGDGETGLSLSAIGDWSGSTGVGYLSLNDAWADDAGGAWAVGWQGTIRYYQGGAWTDVASPTTENLVGVSGTTAADVWAVGEFGTLLHYTGGSWSVVAGTGGSSGVNTDYTGIWAGAPNDVWMTAGGFIVHYDGTTETVVPTDGIMEASYTFTSVWGPAPGQPWFTAAPPGENTAVWTINASTGHIAPVPGVSMWNARSISGTSPTDIWALGDYDLVHFDGTTWTDLTTSIGSSPNTLPGLPNPPAGQWARVAAFAANDVWMTGAPGLIAHYDGTGWTLVSGTDPAMTPTSSSPLLTSIAATSPSDVWIGGRDGTRHFDGNAWTYTPAGANWSEQNAVFSDVASQTVFRVLGTNQDDGPLIVQRLDPSGWTSLGQVTSNLWTKGWASGPSDVYVLTTGISSSLYHYDGNTWTTVTVPCPSLSCTPGLPTAPIGGAGIGGSAPNNVWVVATGVLNRFDGTAWTQMALPTSGAADGQYSVWTDGPTHGWIGGNGAMFEVQGTQITRTNVGGLEEIQTIAGSSTDLYAAGGSEMQSADASGVSVTQRTYGCMYHFDGTSWTEEVSGSGAAINGLWPSPDGSGVWAVAGGSGVLLKAGQ